MECVPVFRKKPGQSSKPPPFYAVCVRVCVCVCVSHYTCLSSTQSGKSPLMEAASRGKTEVVKELVKSGANLNLQDKVCPYIEHDHFTQHIVCSVTTIFVSLQIPYMEITSCTTLKHVTTLCTRLVTWLSQPVTSYA